MSYRYEKVEINNNQDKLLDTDIIIPEETESTIHGEVIDEMGRFIKNVFIELAEIEGEDKNTQIPLKLLHYSYTDKYGQFAFGPINTSKKYTLKIWIDKDPKA